MITKLQSDFEISLEVRETLKIASDPNFFLAINLTIPNLFLNMSFIQYQISNFW